MSDVRFSQAAGAYQDALRAAERIIQKSGGGGSDDSSSASGTSSVAGGSFLDMVGSALKSAESLGVKSESTSNAALSGKAGLSDVVSAVASAENALNTVVAVRDKVIGAYQEIIRMAI